MKDSWQDYITVIFKLNMREDGATNKSISKWLQVSPPSVTEMLKKLRNQGLVVIKKNCVELTAEGIIAAEKILSKHRLWEIFLQQTLNYTWKDVHEEAKALQYVTSDKLMDKLNEFLNYPPYCPHGGIIFLNNKNEFKELVSLAKTQVGDIVTISRLSDQKKLLDYADRKNIKIGDIYKVTNRDDFDGNIELEKDHKISQIGSLAAEHIFVTKE